MKTHSNGTHRALRVSTVLAVAAFGMTRFGFAESAATQPSAQTQPAQTVVAQATAKNGSDVPPPPPPPTTGPVAPAASQPTATEVQANQPLSRPAEVSKQQIEEALRRARASTQRKADLAAAGERPTERTNRFSRRGRGEGPATAAPEAATAIPPPPAAVTAGGTKPPTTNAQPVPSAPPKPLTSIPSVPRLPAEQRKYFLSFQGATWEEVLNTFCRLSGLTIIGQYPRGPTGGITYINPRELTYFEAMHELNVLLTELGPSYWMAREKDDHLILRRMSDWYRYVPQANQFEKPEDFQKAKLTDDDWVTVFYTPPKDQVLGDLIVNIQQTMPDNVVRAAPMGETNRLKITGIAFYVRQFLKMAENPIFQSETYDAQKQRQVKFYKIERANATSVEAVIRNLVLPMGRPRIGTQTEQAEQVEMVLEQMSNTLIVKANQKWHREIEAIIKQIEQAEVTGEATPTFIELKNARAEELAMLLNPLLQAQSSMRPTWKRGEIDRERVYIQAEPATNSLIVLATKDGMKRVEPLVKQLDTASPETTYKRVVLENARADQVFNLVNTIVQSRQIGPGRRGATRPLQIVPDSQGNAIFVMGNPKDIEYAEKIIKELDTADVQRASAHVVKLKKARPTVVMQGLDALFGSGAAMRRGAQAGALRMIPDENSQILVVVCNDKDWKEIDPAIKQFDSEVVSLDPINKTISIQDGDAEELAQTLNNIFRGRLGRSPVTIAADRKTNMLFVTALESAFEEIESLVKKLDVPGKEGQLEILPLENAQATEVAALIQQMFADRTGRFARGAAAGPQIIPDPIANALIVRASKSDFEEIEIQAARLDDAAKVVGIKPIIIQLEYADPMQVASLCEVLFIRGGSRARQMDRTTFFQPHRTGLIVRAPAQQMKEIQEFIKSLDSPEVENVEVKTVQVPGQDVGQLASTLDRVFSAERSRRGGGVMNFMPNPGADMLIITAPKKRFEEIDKVIKQYTEGVKVSTANMKMFDLKNARVDEVGELLQQMLAAAVSRGGRSAAFRQVQILREPRQNKLILFAPDDVMKQAEEMVKQLDVPLEKDAGGVQWIAMENTDASYVASTLNSMWSQRATSGRRSFRSLPVQIWPEPITNSVLIIAPTDEFKEIEAFAKKLDAQAKIASTQPTTIKLEYAEPRYVVQMCEEMFLSQTALRLPGRRTAPAGDSVSFTATKSGIMIRAPQTRMKTIEEFIKTLDKPETSRVAVKTYHLPGLNVEQLYQTLQTVFGRMQLKRDEPQISFILDAPRETIIVSADTSRMTEIDKLITDFKAANVTEPSIQEMVPVQYTRASYAATQLDSMLRRQLVSRSKRLADQLQITPEDRQNKVIIYAPKDVLELAKKILAQIDVPVEASSTQATGIDLAIVKWIPMEHVDSATAAATVKQIWTASLPPQLTNERRRPIEIWGETITNSVLVAGAYGKDFQEIERIAKDIDSKAVANPNKPVLIKLEYASPSEVASMLQAMFVPVGKRGQEKVLIQVVSTGIIVRAPKIEMDQIQEFIKGYDVAESTGLKIRSFYLPNTNVSELSSTLSTVFTYKKRKANEPGWSFVPNTGADSLMVLAPEARFKEIEDVIKQYTENVQKTESKMHLIDVKHMRASEVYSVLSNLLIEKVRRTFGARAASQIQMSYEARQNKLVVFAPDEVMKQVEEMVKQIDVELKDDTEDIKWIPIEFADASDVASTVQSFFSRKQSGSKQRQNLEFRDVQIWPEMVTNSLLVSAPKKEYDEIEKLAKKIDGEYAEKGLERVKITPKYVTASQVQSMITQLFTTGRRRDVSAQMKQQIKIIPAGAYSFFLEAPKDKLPAIQKLIAEMDTEGENTPVIKTYKMGNANVTEIARALTTAMQGIGSYIPEPRRGVLIVSAPKHHFEKIEKTMEELKAEIKEEEKQFEVITLKYARPSSVYSTLSQLVSLQLSERRTRSGRSLELSLVPDDNNNRLFVHAGAEEMALVKKMLEQLDVENLRKEAELHTIALKRTDCTYMYSKILQVFTPAEQQRRAAKRDQASRDVIPIQVVPEPTTNALLITCTEEDFRDIELFVAQMEDAFVEKEKIRELITPKFVSYSQLMSTINAIYNPPAKSGTRRKEIEDIRAIPATGTSFFLECPKDRLADIKKLIETLDTEDKNQPIVRTYKLGDVDLSALSRMLQTTLSGKGTFMTDPQLGMLIVSAPEYRFEQIEKTINQLKSDIEETKQQFEVIPLKYARPSSVYGTVTSLVSTQLSQRRSKRGMGIQLTIYPDDSNNRLFVYGAPEELALVKKMLEQLDVENLRKEAELHTIALERTDCEYMVSRISQLFNPAEQARRAVKRGGAARDVIPMQVVAEPVTNSVLIICTAEDFKEVTAFVDQMEKAFVEKEKVRELITPKYVGYSQLMATINSIYNPSPTRAGKRFQRFSDITAIPATGSSFYLECPKDKVAEIKKLIEELDVEDKNQPIVRTYKLGNMDLSALTRMMQTTLSGKGTFYPDPQTGMLVVIAPPHRFEQIEKMMTQLKADIEETKQQFEVIPLKFARPSNVYSQVTSLVTMQMSQARSRRAQSLMLSIFPDDNNNRLFVYAAAEEMALVKKMLEQLDVENLRKEAELHTITLKRTDCTYMYSKITQVFTQTEQQRRAVKRGAAARDIIPIQVVPEPTTNSLLITCTEEDFRDIELFVAQMEDAFVEKEKVRELITPKFISYSQLMATINSIYNPPSKSGTRRKEIEDVRAIPASGSSFYLEAPKDKLPELKKLIADLDVEDRNQPIVRTYKLGDAVNVSTLSRMLQTTLSGKGTFYPDPQLGLIIISAPEHRFEQIEKTMQQLKADIEETRQHFKVFPLKYAKANSIYGQLSSLVQTQASMGRSRRGLSVQLSIIPDAVLNRLFVYAGDDEMKLVEEMLKQFDIEGIEPETQVYPIELANADCSYVSSMVTQMFSQQELERRRRGQSGAVVQPIRIVPDTMSNRLLVWASPQDFKDIEKFVKELDQQAADTKPERRIMSPKFIRVNELYSLIQNLFLSQRIRTGQRVRPVETVMSISGADLILNGPKDRLDEIEAFIKTVDTEERAKMEVRTFSLPDVDMSSLVSTLQSLFSQDARQQRGSMLFLPDPVNSELMVSAPKSLMKDIEDVIAKKQEGAKKFSRKLTIFEVKHVDVNYLASMLTQLVTERTRNQRGRYVQPQVTITPESRTNRLLVMAGEAETKIAEDLLKELDTEAMGLKDQIRVIEMKKAEASYVASTLQAMASGRAQLRRTRTYTATPIYIVAEPMTNRIFVAASEQDYKEIETLAKEMDAAAELQGIQKEKIEVKYAQPQTLVSTVTAMFQPLQTTGRRMPNDVRLTVAGAHTIIAQAPANKMVEIKQWIQELDVQDMAESQTKFFPLEIARAAEIVGIVQPMLTAKSQEITMREGLRAQRSVGLMVIPDNRNNRVIVSGPSQLLVMAEQLIKELDVEDPAWTGETVEIVEVEKAEATQVATVLQQILTGPEGQKALRPRAGAVGQISSLAVTIVPDPTSNTLVLKGLPRDLERVKDLIAQIEEKAVVGGMQVKLYRLKESDAEEVAKVVTTMVNQTADPRSKRNPVQITSDYMMNAVFVAGTTKQQAMVQKIIDMYEKPEMEVDPVTGEEKPVERRPFEFIQLVYSDSYDISYEIENILEKRYGEKKGPTIETMYGDSSTLMVYGKPDEIKAVKELVEMFEKKNMSKPPVTKLIELKDLSGKKLQEDLEGWGVLKPGEQARLIRSDRKEELVPEITIEQAEDLRKQAEQERIEQEVKRIEGKALTPDEKSKKPDHRVKRFGKRSTTQQVSQVSRFVAPSILVALAAELNSIPYAAAAAPAPTTTQAAAARPATAPAPKPVVAPRAQLPIPPVSAAKPQPAAAASAPAAPKPKAAKVIETPTAGKSATVAQPQPAPAAKAKEPAAKVTAPVSEPKQSVAKEPVTKSPQASPSQRTVAEEKPAEPANRFSGSSSARESRRATSEPDKSASGVADVNIIIDEKTGVVQITGPERRVQEMEDLIRRIQDEATTTIEKDVEYRVLKPRYLDVSVAAALLDRVFNEPRVPVPPQPAAAAAAAKAAAAGKKEEKEKEEREERPSLRDYLKPKTGGGTGRIRCIPDLRTGYLIVVAAPETQKEIKELLAKVDVPAPEAGQLRYYFLDNLDAREVEQSLKLILKMEGRTRPQVPAGAAAGQAAAQNAALAAMQAQMQQLQLEGGDITLKATEAVTITSSTSTNTLVVMAPEKILKLIDDYIETLEEEASKSDLEAIPLDSADATVVAQTMTQIYGRRRGMGSEAAAAGVTVSQGGGSRVTITSESSTNTLFIKAPQPLRSEIIKQIKELDQEAMREGKPTKLVLQKADPEVLAPKLQQVFASRGKRRGKTDALQIIGDNASNTLIIRAPETVRHEIEELAKAMDVEGTDLELKIFELKHANAAELHQQLVQMTQQVVQQLRAKGQKSMEMDVFAAVPDPRTNTLVVTGGPKTFSIVEKILAQVDVPPTASTEKVTVVYQLEQAQAADVARSITQLYQGKRGERYLRGGLEPPTSEFDSVTNTVIIRATEIQQSQIKREIIDRLEEFSKTKKVKDTTIELKFAKSDETAQMLNDFFTQRQAGRQRLQQRMTPNDVVTIVSEPNMNALLVRCNDENLEIIKRLVGQLDRAEVSGKGARKIKVFPFEYADPSYVAQAVRQSFQPAAGIRSGLRDRVDATPEYTTGSLIVVASEENMKLVEQMIKEVDQEGPSSKQMHVVEIRNGEPADIALALNQMFVQGRQTKRGGQAAVTIVNPQGTNKIMVMAHETDFKKISDAIKEMDTGTGAVAVRIVRLMHITPEEAQTVLQEFLRKPGRTGKWDTTLLGDVRISISDSAGGLVITAREEKLDELEKLIKKIDVEAPEGGPGTRKWEIFALEYANPYVAAQAITQTFAPRRGGLQSESERVVATADPTIGTLIVSASEKNLVKIRKLIEDLDKENKAGREVQVMTLKKARAQDVAQTLTAAYRSRMRTQRGDEPVSVTAEPDTNSLIIAAKKSEYKEIEELVNKLDIDPTSNEVMRVIPLDYIDAAEALTIMQDYLKRSGAVGGRGGTDLAGGTRVSASDSMNALVLSGKQENIAKLETVVKSLDAPSAQMDRAPKIITLKAGQAGVVASILTQVFTDPARTTAGRRRAGTAQEMVPIIMADESTNSLIVRARKTDFAMIEEMATKLDRADLGTGAKIITLPPVINASELATTIERVVNEGERARAQQTGRRAAMVAVAADDRSNSLIVSGSAEQFAQVERLVKDLQEAKPAGPPAMRVIRLKQLQATELKQVLDQMMEQQGSRRRRSGY